MNAKGKWEPPVEKTNQGLFVLGDEPSGNLKFKFTLNPLAIKELEKQMKKASDDGDHKKLALLKNNASKPVETLEVNTITKTVSSETMANNFFDMLVSRYQDEDESNMLELIRTMATENSMWFSQAHEALYVCKLQQ
jgi:hypothetical protein